jgi:hypothetical protein
MLFKKKKKKNFQKKYQIKIFWMYYPLIFEGEKKFYGKKKILRIFNKISKEKNKKKKKNFLSERLNSK